MAIGIVMLEKLEEIQMWQDRAQTLCKAGRHLEALGAMAKAHSIAIGVIGELMGDLGYEDARPGTRVEGQGSKPELYLVRDT